MNIRIAFALPLVAAPWILPAPASEELSFHVASGTELTRTFESHQEISLDDAEILLNGQPFPSGDKGGMTALQGMKLEVTDVFTRVEEGKPRLLRRAFDKIESTGEQTTQNPMGAGERTDTRHAKSELSGKTVVFEWDEAKEKFAKRFEPEGPDESLV
ncbi:MAG TPA: hypothetical protein VM509_02570, partial [Planctomycetota bacterium]|nr:hypothetical protein [Planctomycetota bacterium]